MLAFGWLAACTSPLATCAVQSCPEPKTLTIFAASSLQPAFGKIGNQFQANEVKAQGHVVNALSFVFAGSQMLTQQLGEGAAADIFASADIAHMTQVNAGGLVASPPRVFAHNRLEIAVARGNPKGIHTLADLARSGLVVVLADPSVPAGKYAAQALKTAGVTVKPASLEQQVTGVLSKVAFGEADAGIVYVSDIITSRQVDGVAIPNDQNVIAEYPIAVLNTGHNQAAAKDFVDFVLSADGQSLLKAAGFEGV
ncbi:MAG: molybdate ABC transporter substrate-binding protein [Chloroflexi bacterium 13_1_40CM_3_65_12]|nr:MAG: molybdate ABC transporter substrate-binding protein [Chloroflexi bacterium 13_1_40CM_65_17]OLC48939.1 MAG: molybdate ABC transporter substrate-binding protein [Chloroflexi bacterium 13_1_40CM_4_65_13]OLD26574.1 MAG: molybdate ABC transporter substrate-binding protein [Chloroflexi bacterium 13_1_40CM_3_65_12]